MKKTITALLMLITSYFHADWNSSFDEATSRLLNRLGQGVQQEYLEAYETFILVREECLRDQALQKKIAKTRASERKLFFLPRLGAYLKKRKNNAINDLYAWEISTLFGSYSCVVPSFPLKIGGKLVIMQRQESFIIEKKGDSIWSQSLLRRISLDNYWKANLQVYLLGIKNLIGKNIGINDLGEIRLFNLKDCFVYDYPLKREKTAYGSDLFCLTLGWPQYREPLDRSTVSSLKKFIYSLSELERDIKIYLMYRPFSLDLESFLYRLNKIRSFPLKEGMTFYDFYDFLL